MRRFSLFLMLCILASCSEKPNSKTPQEDYESYYSRYICIRMEVYVEEYEKDPYNNTWAISQGITSADQRDEYILRIDPRSLKRLGWNPSKDFTPNPSKLNIQQVSQKCPQLTFKFLQIPF